MIFMDEIDIPRSIEISTCKKQASNYFRKAGRKMKNELDLQIKNELEKSKPQIPNGYEKKMSDTLKKISEFPKVSKTKYLIRVAAAMVCIILVGTGSIYAAKNYLGQRLKEMDTAKIEQYNDRTQSSVVGADRYSRDLT